MHAKAIAAGRWTEQQFQQEDLWSKRPFSLITLNLICREARDEIKTEITIVRNITDANMAVELSPSSK